ncbi:hypothetical protein SAMN05445756_1718 [Kytococcus aerolatus]|uniref:LPXTG-motif cell wall anchor domain-containing protein n=1 Tax=Kytococcus aerolatus TaxID=592308 RepID=A0A212U1H8_9MICO|nr:hypothetical protein [Kytococcus aerolatus]SNC72078.1 hypothetical protein SAMN05445756_1718 [Kytococcus aerolatus]
MMKRTLTTLALAGMTLTGPAVWAAPSDQPQTPLDTTFSPEQVEGDGPRAWEITVDGERIALDGAEDGMGLLSVEGQDHPDFTNWTAEESLLGNRDTAMPSLVPEFYLPECPASTETVDGPATLHSDDEHVRYDADEDVLKPVEVDALTTEHRLVEVSSATCDPSETEEIDFLFTTAYYVSADADGAWEHIGSRAMKTTFHEGNEEFFHPAEGWEWLEDYYRTNRPEGLTDEEWADQVIADGTVPEEYRWFITGETAGQDDDENPIIDTGLTTHDATLPALALGLGLLGAGGVTLAGATRRR